MGANQKMQKMFRALTLRAISIFQSVGLMFFHVRYGKRPGEYDLNFLTLRILDSQYPYMGNTFCASAFTKKQK
jgi:hypothetical protein